MIVVIDYGVGNLSSIENMFKKCGVRALISNDAKIISRASGIVLPGMGAFDNCMERFNRSGLRKLIETKVLYEKTPVLGICVGLQMFMESSEEGILPGLGWVKGKTVRFSQDAMDNVQKVPNMSWLNVAPSGQSALLSGTREPRFYFAHSYHVVLEEEIQTKLIATYGYEFVAGIENENIAGVQFHPEKSHKFGMQLLTNFVENYQCGGSE